LWNVKGAFFAFFFRSANEHGFVFNGQVPAEVRYIISDPSQVETVNDTQYFWHVVTNLTNNLSKEAWQKSSFKESKIVKFFKIM
jgi:hypothetical protein